tara:strand:- start:368 stop:1132 length:765 start_codon:yes stop_codon:yes gene_type:complete
MAFDLPKLPYAYDALEPHISADTLHCHYDKHHQGYVDKLNKAVSGTPYADMSLEEVIQKSADKGDETGIFNSAAQHWNHSFFWSCMTGKSTGPTEELTRRIESDLGGFDDFADLFTESATGQFGSGWAWLVLDNGKLKVTATPNAEPPMIHGQHALLTCDVWEHAYYLDYQNRREEFVTTFLKHLVNWDFVAENLRMQGEGNHAAGRAFQDAQHDYAKKPEKVSANAAEAREALEGEEAEELEEARRKTAAGQG